MKNQSGFTLVEIAIVLVIIGLLLGGVLKGQELINSAKVKNIANDLRAVSTFIYAYQDKFKALPGDDPLVVNHVGVGATPNATLCTANPSPCAGDARINGIWNAALGSGTESYLFWQHVRIANLASGTPDINNGEYIPRNADGGPIGITGDSVSGNPNPWPANFYTCTAGVQGRFARQIDTTIDDGNTQTGTVRVIGVGTVSQTAVANTFINVTAADDANLYTVCVAN